MKLAITGASGLTGSYFLDRLEKEGFNEEIICIIRRKTDINKFDGRNLKITFAIGELNDIYFLTAAIIGCDVLLNIAGASVSECLLKAAQNSKIKWIISVHTTGIYSKYKSASIEYSRIEQNIQKTKGNVAYTLIRPTMIYGINGEFKDHNIHKLIRYLSKNKIFPMFGEGNNLMQPVYARDLGNAYYDILSRPEITKNKEYNLSGESALTYMEIINITSKALGEKNIVLNIPISISINLIKFYNLVFGNKAFVNVEQVLRMQEDKAFSHSEAFRDFGYDPIGFEEGIQEEVREMESCLKKRRRLCI